LERKERYVDAKPDVLGYLQEEISWWSFSVHASNRLLTSITLPAMTAWLGLLEWIKGEEKKRPSKGCIWLNIAYGV
jgi:hypothetical protein